MLAPIIEAGQGRREPWNKGKLVGQKAPLNFATSGLFAYGLR
jgi:hypothetical protein